MKEKELNEIEEREKLMTEETETLTIPEEKPEVKIINNKVISFGLVTISAFLLLLCTVMVGAFFIMAGKYIDQSERSQEQSENTMTLQRALDRSDGKLQVYETYLVNRNIDIVKSLITRFLKTKKKRSTNVTIRDFEEFLGTGCSVCPSHEGPGGR